MSKGPQGRTPGPTWNLRGYGWRLWFVPISEAAREALFEQVALKARVVARDRRLREFTIEREIDGGDTVLVISSQGRDGQFRIDVSREQLRYQCDCHDLSRLGRELETVAVPLLRAAMVPEIAKRLLRCSHSYDLGIRFSPAADRRPNLLAITTSMTPGLSRTTRTIRAAQLGRIDLKWGLEAQLARRSSTLWFEVVAAGNDDHTEIDLDVQIQSSTAALPDPAWSINLHRVHEDAVPAIVDVIEALTTAEATHGDVKKKRASKT